MSESAQNQHDEEMRTQKLNLMPKEGLESLLKQNDETSSLAASSTGLGMISALLRDHPTLTEERAIQMLEEAGAL